MLFFCRAARNEVTNARDRTLRLPLPDRLLHDANDPANRMALKSRTWTQRRRYSRCRDEKLNAQLVPLFDPTGRLFLASDDPTPVDGSLSVTQQIADLQYGVVSINEVRSQHGLPAVPWGNVPWLPLNWDRTDAPRPGEEPGTGRNRGPKTRRA
jgi:hypothetical protein